MIVTGVLLILSLTLTAQTLTPQEVKKTIEEIGFKYPELIYEQYKIESALGQSRLAREQNSLFGMKSYKSRGGLNLTPTKTFASYISQRESIIDRYILEVYNGWHKLSRQDYLKQMRKTYCENCSTKYLDK